MKNILSVLILFFACNFLLAQAVKSYDKVCYCSGNQTPHRIVSYDNNFEILLSLRNGMSKAELKAHNVPFTESQLKLLEVFKLIEKKEKKYFTLIPILDTTDTKEIRKLSKRIASEILLEVESKIADLVSYINANYNTRSEFSILYSYVFDGLAWREFEHLDLIAPQLEDKEVFTWSGHFWMVPFKRASRAGTNSSTVKNTTLYITNGMPWKYLKPLYAHRDKMSKMVAEINDYGSIKNKAVIDQFFDYNIYDDKGKMLVPIIYENDGDALFNLATSLSQGVTKHFLEKVNISELAEKYSFADSETALVIFYHEVIWDLIALMQVKKLVEKPQILVDSSEREFNEMADLIFMVVKK